MSIPKPKNIPSSAGIYVFRSQKGPIYVGKAVNLKKRVFSYFRKRTGQKVKQLLREATTLDWLETSSEIGAFLKEAELIKKHRPKYNIVLRDDKNYFYVGITQENFPKVFITHQPTEVQNSKIPIRPSRQALGNNQNDNSKFKVDYIGPFTSGASLKLVLKLLRRVFPYCTCKNLHKRPCLNSQIGRCFGYCCMFGYPSPNIAEYQNSIKGVKAILNGRGKKLISSLKKEMKMAAKNQDFEAAAQKRNQIFGLENIFSHRLFLASDQKKAPRDYWSKMEKDLRIILNTKNSIARIEGYDISNISGQEATGSVAVFTEGQPAKAEYRKFRIKTIQGISDVDMLKEVIRRRLKHSEWPWPDFMLIDGGRGQLNAAVEILKKSDFPREVQLPKVAALAKREEELYLPGRKFPLPLKNLPSALAQLLQRVRDESHRFARAYHHNLRKALFCE